MFTLCPHRYRHPMLIAYEGVQYYTFNEFRIILNEWFAYLSQWIYSLAAWYFSGCFVEHWFCGFRILFRLYNVVGIYQMKCQSNFIQFYLVFSLIFFWMLNQVLTKEFCISCLLSMTFEYYSLISLNYTFSLKFINGFIYLKLQRFWQSLACKQLGSLHILYRCEQVNIQYNDDAQLDCFELGVKAYVYVINSVRVRETFYIEELAKLYLNLEI